MVDPIAASAVAAFGLEPSFQLVSFLLLKHRSPNSAVPTDDLVNDLADAVYLSHEPVQTSI